MQGRGAALHVSPPTPLRHMIDPSQHPLAPPAKPAPKHSRLALQRFFGFIEASGESVEELTKGLGPQEYDTKTRGTRHLAAGRRGGKKGRNEGRKKEKSRRRGLLIRKPAHEAGRLPLPGWCEGCRLLPVRCPPLTSAALATCWDASEYGTQPHTRLKCGRHASPLACASAPAQCAMPTWLPPCPCQTLHARACCSLHSPPDTLPSPAAVSACLLAGRVARP